MSSSSIENDALNKNCLEVVKIRVIAAVKQNINTKAKSDKEMVDEIRNLIIEEATKNY